MSLNFRHPRKYDLFISQGSQLSTVFVFTEPDTGVPIDFVDYTAEVTIKESKNSSVILANFDTSDVSPNSRASFAAGDGMWEMIVSAADATIIGNATTDAVWAAKFTDSAGIVELIFEGSVVANQET